MLEEGHAHARIEMARIKTVPTRNRQAANNLKKKAGGAAAEVALGKKERKPHRWRSGTVALREIKRFQKSVDTLIPKLPLRRVIREVAAPYQDDLRFSGAALEALQQASEAYIVDLFTDANECAIEHDRVTIEPRDMRLAMRMRHDHNLPQVTTLAEHSRKPKAAIKSVPSKRRVRKSKQNAQAAAAEETGEHAESVAVASADQPPSF